MTENTLPLSAVVTGASSGIGAATVRRLRREGWDVLAVARRQERLQALAEETGCRILAADLTQEADVARLAEAVGPQLHALVNNAGGAFGVETVEHAKFEDWSWMYEINVMATLRVTQALLPALRASGRGDLLVLTSIAGHTAYEGGAGYCGVKAAERMIAQTLRLELNGEPIRVIEVAPGLVHTEEFSLNRLGGDQARADNVYAGVEQPLVADDVADCITWTLTRPQHVNIDLLVVKPVAQAAPHKLARTT